MVDFSQHLLFAKVKCVCKKTGQQKDVCFCENCLLEDSQNPPAWATEPKEIETGNYDSTVQYVREQIKLMTNEVRKANRTPMATRATAATRATNGIQRLEIKDLTTDKKRLKILWVGDPREAGVNADWATISVKFVSVATGTKRIYTMGNTNPCYDALIAGFGEDDSKWINKEIFAWKIIEGVREMEFMRFACIGEDGNEIPFDYAGVKKSGGTSSAAGL